MAQRLRIGFSSCPNDTFVFHALATGGVAVDGVELEVVMEDIEALNARALEPGADRLPITKLSTSAFLRASSRYACLRSGAALGHGCGPLVVCRDDRDGPRSLAELAGMRVAVPGLQTTAYLLLRSFGPEVHPMPMRFDRIMPAVVAGEVDAGLVIHEGRFTYPDHGLREVADLGEVWEAETSGPLPLGVIAIDREHLSLAGAVETGIAHSILAAREDPTASAAYVREHAQELGEDVSARHIELYVNAFSIDLGADGRAAIENMYERGRATGLLPRVDVPLFAAGGSVVR